MKHHCLVGGLVVVVLLGVAVSLAAQSDAVFLGRLSEPFATFAAVGDLSYPGELDWYGFEVVDEGRAVHVLAKAADGEPGIRALLFGPEGGYIAAAQDDVLTAELGAGTYRIRIDSVESGVRSYSLLLFTGTESESNDGLLEANDLGEIAGPVVLIASLLPEGDADVFRFSIPEAGLPSGGNALAVETSGPQDGDTALVLYRYTASDDRYLPVASDDDSGDGYWSRLMLHPQGGERYAVRAEETTHPLSGIESYLFSITPHWLGADEEPNDAFDEAAPLPPTGPDRWMSDGLLDPGDAIDFFALNLQTPSLVRIWTEPQPGAGDFDTLLGLYDSDGSPLVENDDTEDTTWSRLVLPLSAGTYAIAVEANDSSAALLPYRLRASAQSVRLVSENEPNDDPDTAEPVEWRPGDALLIQGEIAPEGDVDGFRLALESETAVVFQVGPRSGAAEPYDTTLSVYDEDLDEVAYNDDADGAWSRIEETLPAGTYYVVVESYYGDEAFEYALLMMRP